MAVKKKKQKKVILSAPAFLLLGALFIIVILFSKNAKINEILTNSTNETIPTRHYNRPKQTKTNSLDPIQNHISFNVPKGWKVAKDSFNENVIILHSNDYVELENSPFGTPKNGILIRISYTDGFDNPWENVKDKYNSPLLNYQQKKELIKIDGFDSVSYIERYEGLHRTIEVANGTYMWHIIVNLPTDQDPNDVAYSTEIENFLSSIEFK